MKNIILFSAIFYLIGLALGGALENVKNAFVPTKTIFTVPAKKLQKSDDAYELNLQEKEKSAYEADSTRQKRTVKSEVSGQKAE